MASHSVLLLFACSKRSNEPGRARNLATFIRRWLAKSSLRDSGATAANQLGRYKRMEYAPSITGLQDFEFEVFVICKNREHKFSFDEIISRNFGSFVKNFNLIVHELA